MTGRYLIAADGAKGPTSKWLGFKEPKRRSGAVLEVPATAVDSLRKAFFEFGMVKNGYIWRFPKADGYSLGIATFRGNDPNDLNKLLTEYAQKSGLDGKSGSAHGAFSLPMGRQPNAAYAKCTAGWGSRLCG